MRTHSPARPGDHTGSKEVGHVSVSASSVRAIDSAVLRAHGRPEIRPGMDEARVRKVLRDLRR